MRNLIDKILNWYFSKNALPYWCIFIIDCGIVMASGIMTYWLFNSTQALYDNTFRVINTLICFVLLSVPGFRLFHTYSGYMRFAGFVDLMRVVYGNLVSLVLVLLAQFGAHLLPEEWFVDFRISAVFLIYLLATLMMWCFRVFVKTLYDVAFSDDRCMRILIYGAMQGGVGLAKSIRNQRPRRYVVKGFIANVFS